MSSNEYAGRFNRLFTWSAIGILIVTGIAKLVSAFGSVELLKSVDPILGLSNRTLLLLVGTGELIVAALIARLRGPRVKLGLLAWLSLQFVVYHAAMQRVDGFHTCPCLGYIYNWTGITNEAVNTITQALAWYLLIGAAYFWRQSKSSPAHEADKTWPGADSPAPGG